MLRIFTGWFLHIRTVDPFSIAFVEMKSISKIFTYIHLPLIPCIVVPVGNVPSIKQEEFKI